MTASSLQEQSRKEGTMKRREMKFVAGSVRLMPDRIGAASPVPLRAPARPKGRKPATVKPPVPEADHHVDAADLRLRRRRRT